LTQLIKLEKLRWISRILQAIKEEANKYNKNLCCIVAVFVKLKIKDANIAHIYVLYKSLILKNLKNKMNIH